MNYLTSALASRPSSAESQTLLHASPLLQQHKVTPRLYESEKCMAHYDREGSMTTLSVKRCDAIRRSKTTLHFCRPPPVTKQKRLHVKPKILLQLHKRSQETRPIPAFDVLSTTAFASRLADEFPRIFRGKRSFNVDDLVVVGSEDYSSNGTQMMDADGPLQKDKWRSRNIVAVVSQRGGHESSVGAAEICLSNGETWTGSPMPRRGYEFVFVDDHGLKRVARWVPRRAYRRQPGSPSISASTMPMEETTFNFSLIDPNSRRHAVVATLDARSLEIPDRYVIPLSNPLSVSSAASLENSSAADERDMVQVDDDLRTLIMATSIWIGFREGFWGHDRIIADSTRVPGSNPSHKRQSLSLNMKGMQRQNSSNSQSPQRETVLGRLPGLQHHATSSRIPTSPANAPLLSPPFLTPPRRTHSASVSTANRPHGQRSSEAKTGFFKPVSDDSPEPSPVNSRASTKIGYDQTPGGWRGHSEKLPIRAPEPRKKKMSGLKKLCLSFKSSGSSDSSS